MIYSDFHIHSEFSYDAVTSIADIAEGAISQGLHTVGITDHVNLNDKSFLSDLAASVKGVNEAKKKYPFIILGVELTPIAKPQFDYIAKHADSDGYIPPVQAVPYGIELALTKDELVAMGVRYAIGASHWRTDNATCTKDDVDVDACIREWYRQQLWLACDERVTILGHPWYHGRAAWYEDFSVIPKSMNRDIAAALKENGKLVECNQHFFNSSKTTEKFRRQYAEFLRELFEMGIPVTYGSDAHYGYPDVRASVEKYLTMAGFVKGDISDIPDDILWH